MSKHTRIGIHSTVRTVRAVLLEKHAGGYDITHRETLPAELDNRETLGDVLAALGQNLREAGAAQAPAALALGGALYQSELHHSEFDEDKQIDQTLRFDVEEEFMVDADNSVLCYQRRPGDGEGTDLVVHVTPRKRLATLLDRLDEAGMDALRATPDIDAWGVYLRHLGPTSGQPALLVGVCDDVLFLLIVDENGQAVLGRSHLCRDSAAGEVLQRETPLLLALVGSDQRPKKILYHRHGLSPADVDALAELWQCEAIAFDEEDLGHACAAGAALAEMKREDTADFRRDNLPPRTLALMKKRATYVLAGAVALFFLVTAVVLHAHTARFEKIHAQAISTQDTAWQRVHPERRKIDRSRIMTVLQGEVNALKRSGQGGATTAVTDSAGATFLYVLDALGTLPEDFDLEIDTLRCFHDDALLTGSVPKLLDRERMDEVFAASKKLSVASWNISQADKGRGASGTGRRKITISLDVVNGGPRGGRGR